jgi:hypothetical protein
LVIATVILLLLNGTTCPFRLMTLSVPGAVASIELTAVCGLWTGAVCGADVVVSIRAPAKV